MVLPLIDIPTKLCNWQRKCPVRVPCSNGLGNDHDSGLHEIVNGAYCPGWHPSTDLAVWAKAAWPIMREQTWYTNTKKFRESVLGMYMIACASGDLPALQSALNQVMEKEQV